MTITSKAPGKLFIAGEYAVVEPGHGAIVAAVSRYLTVTIDEATSVGTLTSTQNPDVVVEWTREGELFRANEEHPYKLIEEAILVAEQYVRESGKKTFALYSLSITSELDDAKRGIKYGLGSSGAVVVATIQAVLDFYKTPRTSLLVYKLSVLTNLRLSQRGSFGDIAASSFGGMVYYTSPDRSSLLEQLQNQSIKVICDADWKDLTIERLPEIPDFTLLVGWTGQVAITDSLMQATEKKRKVETDSVFYKEFLAKSHAIVQGLQNAWKTQDIPTLQEGIRSNRALLNEFAKEMQLEIETPALQTLCNLAEQNGACAKTSGAGGGDCGICFTQNETQRQQIETQWAKAQIQVLPLSIAEAWQRRLMMDLFQQQMNRKDEHVGHANQQYRATSAPEFVETRFVHHPFTTVDVADVSLQTKLAGLTFDVPFFINAITGGSPLTTALNQRLAILARETGMAMATGSMSIAMKFPESAQSFKIIRQENPNGILFANLGAHYDAEAAKRAVEIIEANAIQIHVNRAQELVMPEGDRVFSNWLKNIEAIVKTSSVPVIVKEVGFGFSSEAIAQLESIGVAAIDISGTGGTNFAKIENGRRKEDKLDFLEDWGQTTLTSLMEAQGSRTPIIASGGVKTPLDMAKCFALGASLVGLSGEMLHLVRKDDSLPDAIHTVQTWKEQLTTILTLVGADSISSLQLAPIVVAPSLQNWCDARGIAWKHLAQR